MSFGDFLRSYWTLTNNRQQQQQGQQQNRGGQQQQHRLELRREEQLLHVPAQGEPPQDQDQDRMIRDDLQRRNHQV